MAHELSDQNVTVVSMYPGLVRTELVMQSAEFLDLSNSESPAVHRSGDRAPVCRSVSDTGDTGSVVVAAAYAREVGFTDIDGRRPDAADRFR